MSSNNFVLFVSFLLNLNVARNLCQTKKKTSAFRFLRRPSGKLSLCITFSISRFYFNVKKKSRKTKIRNHRFYDIKFSPANHRRRRVFFFPLYLSLSLSRCLNLSFFVLCCVLFPFKLSYYFQRTNFF